MKTNKKTPLVYEHKCSCGAEFYDSNPCGKGTVIAIELQKNGKMKVRSNIKDVIVMVWDGKAGPAFKHQPFEVYKDA